MSGGNQPAQEDENSSTGALAIFAILPEFISVVDSPLSTWHFLNEDVLDTQWSSVHRIFPATLDPKTPSRQGCLILWR